METTTQRQTKTASTRMTEQARRAHLLEFGRTHFASHAFDAMPMQAIAERAGVSKGLLYHYFGGRRGFYLATVTDVIEGLLETMQAGEAKQPGQPLHGLIGGFVEYVSDNAAIYQALVRGGLGADPEIREQLDRVKNYAIGRIVGQVALTSADTPRLSQSPRSGDGAFLWNAPPRPVITTERRSDPARGGELSSMARVQLVGWIAWVESATSAWLDTDDIQTSTFVDTVVETVTSAIPSLFE